MTKKKLANIIQNTFSKKALKKAGLTLAFLSGFYFLNCSSKYDSDTDESGPDSNGITVSASYNINNKFKKEGMLDATFTLYDKQLIDFDELYAKIISPASTNVIPLTKLSTNQWALSQQYEIKKDDGSSVLDGEIKIELIEENDPSALSKFIMDDSTKFVTDTIPPNYTITYDKNPIGAGTTNVYLTVGEALYDSDADVDPENKNELTVIPFSTKKNGSPHILSGFFAKTGTNTYTYVWNVSNGDDGQYEFIPANFFDRAGNGTVQESPSSVSTIDTVIANGAIAMDKTCPCGPSASPIKFTYTATEPLLQAELTVNRPGTDAPIVTSMTQPDPVGTPLIWEATYDVLPKNLPGLNDGLTVAQVMAEDLAGNQNVKNRNFNIDTVGANVAITYNFPSPVADGPLIITASFSEPVTTPLISIDQQGTNDISNMVMTDIGGNQFQFVYTVNSKTLAPNTSYVDGTANVTIESYDFANNVNNTPTGNTFNIKTSYDEAGQDALLANTSTIEHASIYNSGTTDKHMIKQYTLEQVTSGGRGIDVRIENGEGNLVDFTLQKSSIEVTQAALLDSDSLTDTGVARCVYNLSDDDGQAVLRSEIRGYLLNCLQNTFP